MHTNTCANTGSQTHTPTHMHWVHMVTHRFEKIGTHTVIQMHKLYTSGVTLHKCTCSFTEILMHAHKHTLASCNTYTQGQDRLQHIAHGWEQTKP